MGPRAGGKRRVLFAGTGIALAIALSGVVLLTRHPEPARRVSVVSRSAPDETTETNGTAASEPASVAFDTAGSALGTAEQSSGPQSPWTVGPTTGIGNFDTVLFDGTGLPGGTYAVGQCPSDAARAGDFFKCHSHLVTVTDGHLVSALTVGWWVAGVDCGTAPGTCLVGVMNTDPKAGWAPVSWNLAFDPARRPSFDITPNTDLGDGEQVEVRGYNFGPAQISLRESCSGEGSCGEAVDTSSASAGAFAVPLTVHASFEEWLFGDDLGPARCDSTTCSVVLTAAPEGRADTGTQWNMSLTLRFAPTPATTTAHPTISTTAPPDTTTSTSIGS